MELNGKRSSVLVFDMDGVLVDVSESYRAAIAATAKHFTGRTISHETIQEYKNAGGWNNDWALSQQLIRDIANLEIPYAEVVEIFQERFLGKNHDGLILQERWLPTPGLLEKLTRSHSLALFTGRPREEVDVTLKRFVSGVGWAAIIAAEDVASPKPAPDGLVAIAAENQDASVTYFGDTVDDARSARAAGVRFIGVASNRSEGLRELLQAEGADAVIENINEIGEVL